MPIHEIYKTVVDPVTKRKWIICMENPKSDDPFSMHPVYANNDDLVTTISKADAESIRKALDRSFNSLEHNWYLEWWETDHYGEFVDEIYLRDLKDETVMQWFNVDVPTGNFEITNDALVQQILKYSAYRFVNNSWVPVPYVINTDRFNYWLRSNDES